MTDVTDADRERATAVVIEWSSNGELSPTRQRDLIATALAEERAKARAPFLALAEKYEKTAHRRERLARKFEERDRWRAVDDFYVLAAQAESAAARIRRAGEDRL